MNSSTSSFNRLLGKSIAYVLAAVLLAYAARAVLHDGIRLNKIGEFEQLNTIFIKKNNYDFLIIGSSRAESHFYPPIIDSILNVNSYNLGLMGGNYIMTRMALEAYLQNSVAPRRVVINIDFHDFRGEHTVYNFPRYFPYLDNQFAYKNLRQLDKRFRWFKYNPFYSLAFMNDRYLYAAIRGFSGYTIGFDKSFVKGYVPVPAEAVDDSSSLDAKPYLSSPGKEDMDAIRDIIALCRKHGSEMIFVVSPVYEQKAAKVMNKEQLLAHFEKLAKENNAVWMNYLENDLCKDIRNFRDPAHLNEKAAMEFSRIFARDLTIQN